MNGGLTPKALAEVKGRPLVEHVMSVYGDHDFTLLLGHLGDAVRLHFLLHPDDRVTLLDTGRDSQTGARVKAACFHLHDAPCFAVAYCDVLADVNVWDVVKFHQCHGKVATLVAVPAVSRFGVLGLRPNQTMGLNGGWEVEAFNEKPKTPDWVSAGFFVFSSRVFEYLDDGPIEQMALGRLAMNNQLMAYRHDGVCFHVDTQKDVEELDRMEGPLPWIK